LTGRLRTRRRNDDRENGCEQSDSAHMVVGR
jgi:hypothetical protein